LTKRLLISLAALALAAFALSACGDDGGSSSSSADSSSSTAADTDTDSDAAAGSGGSGDAGTIQVEADPGGALAWVKTDLTAKAGSNTVELVNDSSTPHTVVIESDSGDEVAESDEVSGDTTSTTADLEPGTYTFYCDIPGHREAGMEGTLTVK
jgi:plastocyanin